MVLVFVAVAVNAPAQAAFSAPVDLSPAAPGEAFPNAVSPDVATDDDGDSIAVWLRFDGSITRVQARTISSAGVLGDVKALSGTGAGAGDPRIATDADGDSIAVWVRDGSVSQIQARRISSTGALGPVLTLSKNQNALHPRVAINANGDAVAVWRRFDGTIDRVQAVLISAAGVLGPVHTLSLPSGTAVFEPDVAIDDDGDAIAVWQHVFGPEVHARRISAAGALSDVQVVSIGTQPKVAMDTDGDATVVFAALADGFAFQTFARTVSSSGILGPVRVLSRAGRTAFEQQVATDADGDSIAVWKRQQDNGKYVVQTRTISDTSALGETKTLSNGGVESSDPQVATDADGDSVITWTRDDGSSTRIQAVTMSATSVVGPVQTISASGQNASEAEVASDADGSSIAVWSRFNGSFNRVQASRGP